MSLVEELEQRPPGFVPPLLRAELRRNRGLLAAARGLDEAVESDLTAAVRAYDELAYPYLRARAQADLGAWLLDRGARDEALEPLEAARETFERLGATPGRSRVDRLLDNVDAGAPA